MNKYIIFIREQTNIKKNLWNIRVMVRSIVIDEIRMILKSLEERLEEW